METSHSGDTNQPDTQGRDLTDTHTHHIPW